MQLGTFNDARVQDSLPHSTSRESPSPALSLSALDRGFPSQSGGVFEGPPWSYYLPVSLLVVGLVTDRGI
jgi:hypothetical protein